LSNTKFKRLRLIRLADSKMILTGRRTIERESLKRVTTNTSALRTITDVIITKQNEITTKEALNVQHITTEGITLPNQVTSGTDLVTRMTAMTATLAVTTMRLTIRNNFNTERPNGIMT
jgi:pilus assembly protein TadC